jgi:L-lactate dehydrogenase
MLDSLWTTLPEPEHTTHRPYQKGLIIGAGQVGMSCAYSMLIQNTLDEMVIYDINTEKLKGEVMDLGHGLPFVQPTKVRAGSIADAAEADIVVITAGAKQKPGESRLDLVHRNVKIFKDLIPEIVKHCPNAILLVVTNPVDIMTYVSLKLSGLPSSMVIGSGTVLDTARFRFLLAEKLEIAPQSLHAYIVGEHGDSEVAVWSKVNIAGTPIFGEAYDSTEEKMQEMEQTFESVKNAAYEVIQRKGATCYAIGLGVTHIVQSILRNQNRVLTVSALMQGYAGIEDVCLSLPAVVNSQGVTRILNLSLTPTEQEQLQYSAQTLHNIIKDLEL